MESKHTKGKWTANLFINEASIYCPESKQGIAKLKYADFDYDEDKVIDNAIHIVKCVNAHDELINQLKGMVEYWENEIGNNIHILHQLPVNQFYRTSKNILKELTNNTTTNETSL